MYLLDACRDYAEDQARGKFNPLRRCFAPSEVRPRARQLFAQAHQEICSRFAELAPPQPDLARRLLVDQLALAAEAALGDDDLPSEEEKPHRKRPEVHLRKRQRAKEQPRNNGCGESCTWCDGCDCFGELCLWGCDASVPDCTEAGCGDLCGGADVCSGCDISCN
jgi:hypothetical protein